MKKGAVMLFLALTLVLPVSIFAADDILAKVNGTDILKSDFFKIVGPIKNGFGGKPMTDKQSASIKQQVTDALINNELLYQEAQKQGIKADEKMLNEQYEKLKPKNDAEKNALKKNLIVYLFIQKNILPKVKISDEEVKKYADRDFKDKKLDEVKDQIKKELGKRKLEQETKIFAEGLKKGAKIETFPVEMPK